MMAGREVFSLSASVVRRADVAAVEATRRPASLTPNKFELQKHGSLENREIIVGDQR
jgi:hypothetical protein